MVLPAGHPNSAWQKQITGVEELLAMGYGNSSLNVGRQS